MSGVRISRLGRALSLAVFLQAAVPIAARAQSITISAAPAIPLGEFGDRRSLGGQLSLAIAPTHTRRGFATRAEISQAWFPTRDWYAGSLDGQNEGVVFATGILGYVLYTAAPGRASFHGGLGLGAFALRIQGRTNPFPWVPGIGVVAGVKLGEGRVRGLIELHDQVIVSDYGNTLYAVSAFVPVRFGVTVQTR